jgi:hypothetical protein
MPPDSFTSALARLDPASRALLDLSLRRGMRTDEIADALGADPASVEASRDEALRRIAADVGMGDDEDLDVLRTRLAELPADEWLGNGGVAAEAPEAEAAAEAEEPEPSATTQVRDEPKRRGSILPLVLGLLLTIGVIVAIAVGTSGDSDSTTSSQAESTPSASTSTPAQTPEGPKAAKLAPIGARKASGTARVNGNQLTLQASGLRRGAYEVWLYNSIIDARPIGKAKGRTIKLNAKLPGNWKRFRFVDVSRENGVGNLSHSGESVLRVSTNALGAKP